MYVPFTADLTEPPPGDGDRIYHIDASLICSQPTSSLVTLMSPTKLLLFKAGCRPIRQSDCVDC